jgi:hypothetical protein
MIVQCGHCGAPLDVSQRVHTTKCRYCGQVNERERLRTLAEVTPKDFAPPRVWTPPPEFAADSSTPLKYQSGGGGKVLVAIGLVFAVVIALNLLVRGGAFATSPDTLAKGSIAGTPQQVATSLSGDGFDTNVAVRLRSDEWERVGLVWDRDVPEHPTSFFFAAKHEGPNPRVHDALDKALRGGLDPQGNWSWEGISLGLDPKSGQITASVRREHGASAPNPLWKRQLVAAWKVALGAALGRPSGLAPEEARELLGAGYPFADLATLDPSTTVDRAAGVVQAKFPGSPASGPIGVDLYVATDHPFFQYAEVRWENAQGAPLSLLHFSASRLYTERREPFVACLQASLGEPQVTVTDFLKGKRSYRFEVDRLFLSLHESTLDVVHDDRGKPMDPGAWKRILGALEKCRGS